MKKEQEILNKLITLIFELKDEINIKFDYCCNREEIISSLEDYEIKDMDEFLKEYPYMKVFSYGLIYALQSFYNSEFLCAGWCGCYPPERIVEYLKQFKKHINNIRKGEL